jgi:hypothetical protein
LFKPVIQGAADHQRGESEYERTGSLTGQIEKSQINIFFLFLKVKRFGKFIFCSCSIALHMFNSVQLSRCVNARFADIKLWEDFINIFSVDKS